MVKKIACRKRGVDVLSEGPHYQFLKGPEGQVRSQTMADVAATVVGLLGTAKTCIDLWNIILTARRAGQESEHLTTHLQTERIRFLLWCQITGHCDLAKEVESREQHQQQRRRHSRDAPSTERSREDKNNLLLRPETPTFLRLHVEQIMTGMCLTLRGVEEMTKRQEGTTGKFDSMRRSVSKLKWSTRKNQQTLSNASNIEIPLVEMDYLSRAPRPPETGEVRRNNNARQNLGNIKHGFNWAVHGKQDFTEQVAQLKKYNDGLREILDLLDRHRALRLQRWIETAVAATTVSKSLAAESTTLRPPMPEVTQTDPHLLALSHISQQRHDLERLAKMEEEGGGLLQELLTVEDQISEQNDQGKRDDQLFRDGFHREIDATKIDIPFSDSHATAFAPERDFAFYENRPIIIEWRYCSSKLSREGKSIIDYRIHALVSTLQDCSRIVGFHMLRPLGYFFSEDRMNCYGIVYQYPTSRLLSINTDAILSPSVPLTLRDRLVDDLRGNIKCDLQDRFRLAMTISRAIYQYFMVGWFHKNVRSTSILFFESLQTASAGSRSNLTNKQHLTQAYLGGFGFSRRNARHSVTEDVPSIIANIVARDKEWLLYVHPHRRQSIAAVRTATAPPTVQDTGNTEPTKAGSLSEPASLLNPPEMTEGDRSERSHMIYDTYGLGIILLEIALWCPVIKLCSRQCSVDQFQKSIMDTFEARLVFSVGQRYVNVVKWCLEAAGTHRYQSTWGVHNEDAIGDGKGVGGGGVGAADHIEVEEHDQLGGTTEEEDDKKIDSQLFLEAFESHVVTELEKLALWA